MTTTGYGDIVPDTTPGRIAGGILMLAGLVLLGSLAASVASFLTAGDAEARQLQPGTPQPVTAAGAGDGSQTATGESTPGTTDAGSSDVGSTQSEASADLASEITALRAELAELRKLLADRTTRQ